MVDKFGRTGSSVRRRRRRDSESPPVRCESNPLRLWLARGLKPAVPEAARISIAQKAVKQSPGLPLERDSTTSRDFPLLAKLALTKTKPLPGTRQSDAHIE